MTDELEAMRMRRQAERRSRLMRQAVRIWVPELRRTLLALCFFTGPRRPKAA